MVHGPDTTRTLAWLRAGVTLRLLEELPKADVLSTAPGRRSVQIRTPGGPALHITIRDGHVRFHDRPRPFPGVTLFFPRPEHLTATLSGGSAPVVPLPTSPRFVAAINAFRGLTARLRERFADPELRPRLLLLATLYGVEVVANRDPYVAARVARIPDGTIAVRVEGDDRVRGWL
ncbi:MAG: hypothetical protein ACOC1U_02220 [Spirochaetota bacterium]